MFNFQLKTELRKLKKQPVNQSFLQSFRLVLRNEIQANPITIKSSIFYMPRFASIAAVIALIILFSGGSLAWASEMSLPGNILYPIKLFKEKVKLKAIITAEKKEEFRQVITEKRLDEAEIIINKKIPKENEIKDTLKIINQIKKDELDKSIMQKETQEDDTTNKPEIIKSTSTKKDDSDKKIDPLIIPAKEDLETLKEEVKNLREKRKQQNYNHSKKEKD